MNTIGTTFCIYREPQARQITCRTLFHVLISYLLSLYFLPHLQEIRSLRAKHRPRNHDDQIQYKPAVGRDTNTGPLVATKVGWRMEGGGWRMEDGGVEGWMVGVECESGQVRDGVHGEGGG